MEFDDVWTIRLTRSIELEAGMTVATTPWGGSSVKIEAIDRRTKPGRTLVTFDNGDRRDLQTEHDGLPVRWEPAQVIFSYEASDSGSARFSTWVPGDDTLYHYSAEGGAARCVHRPAGRPDHRGDHGIGLRPGGGLPGPR